MLEAMNVLDGLNGASGLQAALLAFDRSAAVVSTAARSATNASADPSNGAVSMADGLTGIDLAAVSIKANLAVMHAADEMLGSIIDRRA
jgi:hypothetical protein